MACLADVAVSGERYASSRDRVLKPNETASGEEVRVAGESKIARTVRADSLFLEWKTII